MTVRDLRKLRVLSFLGVNIGEVFELVDENNKSIGRFRIADNYMLQKVIGQNAKTGKDGVFEDCPELWGDVLFGYYQIVRSRAMMLNDTDKAIIKYAQAAGANWLAKDKSGKVYAYDIRPEKVKDYWMASAPTLVMEIEIDTGIVKWKDAAPLYIGDIGV